jgi:hypothetical protein
LKTAKWSKAQREALSALNEGWWGPDDSMQVTLAPLRDRGLVEVHRLRVPRSFSMVLQTSTRVHLPVRRYVWVLTAAGRAAAIEIAHRAAKAKRARAKAKMNPRARRTFGPSLQRPTTYS